MTVRPWHALQPDAVERALGTSAGGLTSEEAARRLARHGPNALPEPALTGPLWVLLHQFRSPLIYILLLAAAITLALREFIDFAAIGVVLAINAAIGFVQERRAERSVQALMRLLAPHATAVRDGRGVEIESRELVPGDVVLVESGTRVPADLRLFVATALRVDESLLTGESLPVTKGTEAVAEAAAPADRVDLLNAGTVVTSGRGRGYVVATGEGTSLGAITEQVRGVARAETPLQQRVARFARVIAAIVFVVAVATFVTGVAMGSSPSDMFLLVVAMAVSAVPEGLPVALTITLAVGVTRMARRNAVMRRLPAVETLGSTTVIGSDKTGTLTENRMTVREVWAGGRTFTLADEPVRAAGPLYETLVAGALTNEAEIREVPGGHEIRGDPTEAALLIAAARAGIDHEAVRREHVSHAETPFEPERRYSASVRRRGDEHLVFVKGAPERVLGMCSLLLTDAGTVGVDGESVHRAAAEMASRGLRVLAMAYGPAPDDGADPRDLVFLGLQGMLDPPRAGVRDAIAGCRRAGMRVLMITGDHVATARAVAADLGISSAGAPALTGPDLAAMDDRELRERVRDVAVFARVEPEHKLRIVRALQERGEVVAVTGDGVNDAPALKAADIGIAMGRSGTDVAREASDMVLADDAFISIYAAVEEGRIAFDNVRKVTFFLVSTGAAEVIAILTSVVLRLPLPFLPAQILWLNVVTNGLQDVALAFEPGDKDVLDRPPRRRREGILSARLWERTVVTGIVMATGTLLLFLWELAESGSLGRAQTTALTTMVLFQVFHVGNSRSERASVFAKSPFSNPSLFISTAAALGVHVAALYVAPTQFFLRVEPLELESWVRMALVALTIIPAIELHKLLRRG